MMTRGRTMRVAAAIALVAASFDRGVRLQADHRSPAEAGRHDDSGNALSLRATITSARTAGALTITVSRWSTEAERVPLVAAFAPPRPAPAAPPAPAPPPGGRGRGRGAPPPPPSPLAKASAAIKAAPTLGYIWTDGVTGYSIKYAWRSPATEEEERIVLVTDRRLDSHAPDSSASSSSGDADFTVIELRIDGQGVGEGKTSLTTKVATDADAKTLALDGYAAAPALLKVTR
jgi:nucleoid-associated protein YgaU